jgi:FixJ family two-component response regulator
LVILDEHIPLLDGLDTSKIMLKYEPDVRILFMGGDDRISDILKGNGNGNIGLLKKPFLLSTFLDAVSQMINDLPKKDNNGSNVKLFENKE